MIPTISASLAATLIIVMFVVIALVLLGVLAAASIRQQRRYLRTRKHLGGRLLTAQDEERAAIAREIHDDSVQRLIATATRLRATDLPVVMPAADELDKLVGDLRTLARGIHPAVVDHVGIDAALADLCASFKDREGITVEYSGADVPDGLSPPMRLALYRVAQEALGNVARHAAVDRAFVRLQCDRRQAKLVIEDHGGGFDHRAVETGPGLGITSMRERLEILGGELRVDGAPGGGTTITATLPTSGALP